MNQYHKFHRRDFFKWALAAGFSTYLLDKGKSWGQNPTDTSQKADLILYNARIATQNDRRSFAEAVAIKGNRFLAVGTEKEVMAYRGDRTQTINLNRRTVIPGLNDSHTHLIRGGLNYNMELRWDGVPSLADALRMLKEQAARTPAPQWVRVIGGWSEFQFAERRMPTLAEVNAVSRDVPVFILNLYNRALLNGAALRALGIDRNTTPPPGSVIEKDRNGNPTGMLIAKPNAAILYATIAQGPLLSLDDQINSSRHYMREMNRLGITSVIDAGGGGQNFPDDYQIIDHLHKEGLMTVRVAYNLFTQNPGAEKADFERWINIANPGQGDDFYRLNGAGEMLVFSAADFEDFTEPRPDLNPNMEAELTEVIQLLAANKWPFRLHATYNQSISRFLNIFERVNREIPFNGMHWILDHAETISDRNIERVKALGGGIAFQHRMAYQGEYFLDRYGVEAANRTPPIKKIMAMDVPVSGGTDGTRVASYNPWVGLYWLVAGKTVGGTTLYSEANRLDRMEALRLYTTAAAWFSNQEGNKGAIMPGQLADLAVLSEDFFSVPEERIKHLESVLTIVDGQPVYGSEEFSNLSPPPLPISPDWSPVKYFGGYHNDSRISVIPASEQRWTSGIHSQKRPNLKLSSLNQPGSLSQFWGGLACACCY
ncbi:MAG: amidohydrolase [Roseofilum sp. SBFL]|uniref:amidohydrolase n=1 Tax=unclassified Roseofilum TaxID=2620099 RepID=UPI001B0DA24A|nr:MULTISPECIES: amidohydrolase [unclassified Roseofilum]MBP0012719.1 amidohydrolase [Roseofilum sp. SID3]MBP0023020.1 amidohydrolase [Roseofilum sp. SID2]MBP0039300.1 amidohydrolase [Roseofilum sp. SID1]MBP0042279.1 amidohydrolase [Roseofilum sp. SBFL]